MLFAFFVMQGPDGSTGPDGPNGERGSQGSRGPQGAVGPRGIPGSDVSSQDTTLPVDRHKICFASHMIFNLFLKIKH